KLPNENPTIGILLCTEKNDTVVRMTLPKENQSILASEYKLYLPSSEQFIEEINEVKKLAQNKEIEDKE
ncbi:MAG: PDDEXK nuclease domain-containing protein, partial [Bacteroidaceae bacterium]